MAGQERGKAQLEVSALVAGADSIDDMDLLAHGGMDRLSAGIRAPSTLGTFLRAFTFGHVHQLEGVAAACRMALARRTPLLGRRPGDLPRPGRHHRATHAHAEQAAATATPTSRGLNALLAALSHAGAYPVPGTTRAPALLRAAPEVARDCGASGPAGLVLVRDDSTSCTHATIAAAGRGGARCRSPPG